MNQMTAEEIVEQTEDFRICNSIYVLANSLFQGIEI
jgi:hypothetical protein